MLTNRENEILSYCAVGLSAKEIAEKIYRSPETVRKTISNIKQKTGLQKGTELVAYFFCVRFGKDFHEFKRQIIATSFLLILLMGEVYSVNITPYRNVRQRIEFRVRRKEV